MAFEQKQLQKFTRIFVDTYRSLEKESDRGCVIVAAALTEDLLEQCLKSFFLPPIGKQDTILGVQTSNFSTKIELAYRSGLIRKKIYKLLTFQRKLRNEFAHSFHDEGFSKDSVKSYVENISSLSADMLYAVFEELEEAEKLGIVIPENKEKIAKSLLGSLGYRKTFQLAVSLNIGGLFLIVGEIEPVLPLTE
ncbi:hypothetical protein [uncultured Desulfuromusa sp.]|uniref:hypothetical protein n=1 Tax=uncultured Desulfuromusa sp. TaxID=219183 RepID=UPI002AA6D8B3|nr:hypothetical protein [uncultured Desulfuromusa sp.]